MAKRSIGIRRTPGQKAFRVFAYALCIFLAILSLFPFIIMLVNATRDTPSIQSNPISFIFGNNLLRNSSPARKCSTPWWA